MDFIKWVQTRLNASGFNAGNPDGVFGAQTRKALEAFQRRRGLAVNGQTTAETVTALRADMPLVLPQKTAPEAIPVWYAEALRRMGLHETRDYGILSAWLRSDKKTLGDPRKLPWCGDFVQTALALTLPNELQPVNPYLARNWLKFGVKTEPRLGAVLVFWRGSPSGTSGHVGFYAGEDATHYHVLGGNQSNSVSITRIAKNRLLGARWPATDKTKTTTVAKAGVGAVSTNEA